MDGESSAQSEPLTGHRSDPKKMGSMEVEKTSESSQKRVKMRDLDSVFRSEGNVAQAGREGSSTALDLNVDVGSINCIVTNDDPACVDESNNPPISGKKDVQHSDGLSKARPFNLDLNAADISSSINDPFHPYKLNEHLRSRDDSDCVSSVGPLVEKDPLSVWKGLKQNNYVSSSGAVPMAIPKACLRKKSNHDVMKKKMELAKKEQVDRFERVTAPSGLLNGLNPGIINHVRNSKQVHSIIEALVGSERTENLLSAGKKGNQVMSGVQELTERKEAYVVPSPGVYPNTKVTRGDGVSCMRYMGTFLSEPSPCQHENEDGTLQVKLPSSVALASENASCLSNVESSVTSLSLKAATVASQWLELLNHDIRGRLTALRRSRKRVRAVITTELPILVSREFSSNLETAVHAMKGSTVYHFDQVTADPHIVKWRTLFSQMENSLSEEESHLENWLNQVKEMQLNCEMGLNKNGWYHASQQTDPIGNNSRSGAADESEKDLAVRAAAASIYSTCNFLLSKENLPCC